MLDSHDPSRIPGQKGSKLYLPCGTRDRVCKSGTVPDVSGRLAAMLTKPAPSRVYISGVVHVLLR